MSLLTIKELSVDFKVRSGTVRAVDHVSLYVDRGEAVGIVGESGCGKTSLGLAVPMLLAPNASIATGSITLGGQELVGLSETEMNQLRWTSVAFVFQGAMNALNPVQRVDRQILEAITTHEHDVDKHVATDRVLELLDQELPPRVLWWYAPTRVDRDGPRVYSITADRRRAHDRPRRHKPNADTQSLERPAPRQRPRVDDDLARPLGD
jgi:ABC-type glutathione transport system ATPase component